jgi:hypothetical protein
MAAPRINPPLKCAALIKQYASQGFSLLGIAEQFNVELTMLESWMKTNPKFEYAYKVGIEIERQELHRIVADAAAANLPANNNARFLLRTKHGYVEAEDSRTSGVTVAVQSVMVVVSHGSNDQWQDDCIKQQAALTMASADQPQHQIEGAAPQNNDALEGVEASDDPQVIEEPVPELMPAPVVSVAAPAPSWQVPYYRPPVLPGQPVPRMAAPCWKARA